MKRINWILTASTATAVAVTIERFSFTTKVVLSPYSFLRLHEVFQMIFLILVTAILPFFLLKSVTNNFELMKSKWGTILGVTFIVGLYFYGTGNGVHEVTSYLFNSFCNVKHFSGTECGSTFFNDFYFGNILYFAGALLSNIVVILFEIKNPDLTFTKRDITITLLNSVIFCIAVIAYAAFDRVVVGLAYALVAMIAVDLLLLTSHKSYKVLPFTSYCAAAYTAATIISVIIRFHQRV